MPAMLGSGQSITIVTSENLEYDLDVAVVGMWSKVAQDGHRPEIPRSQCGILVAEGEYGGEVGPGQASAGPDGEMTRR